MKSTAVLLAAFAIACQGAAPADSSAAQVVPGPRPTPPTTIPDVDASRRTALTEATARVAPAVVTVQTQTVERVPVDFFGMLTRERVSPGIGSGFIIRENGVVLTNAHVVQGANTVSVMMRDGTTYTAKVLGQDETNDVAVVKIDARNLPVAPLGDSDNLMIGEWAIAIGNPFGFALANSEPSVTAGVISATGRNLLGSSEGAGVYVDMIQTDASINPGNSGGPLVNSKGEVIGINSSIYTPSQGSVGLGFAIPINRARRVAEDLIEHGEIRRPWVGELLRTPAGGTNPRDVINSGVVLRGVVPGSPAAAAGLRAGDQITKAGNRNVRNAFDWEAARLSFRVGDRVPLVVKRGDRDVTVNVTIADRPEVSAPKVTVLREIELTTLTAPLRAERGLTSTEGALVTKISDRLRDEIGLTEGDVILRINDAVIESADDVTRALNQSAGRRYIRAAFERRGTLYYTDFIIR
jgi:serine protease Do